VRQVFAQAGFDREHFGTVDWNPLARYIHPGQRVFVLCNFVYHQRAGETWRHFAAKCTHGSVLRAVVDYALLATGPTGSVRFGNAPVQSCNWDAVLAATGGDRLQQFYSSRGVPVQAQDLRLYVAERNRFGAVTASETRCHASDAVSVLLDGESLLAECGGLASAYRVTDYDPRTMAEYHAGAAHRYLIHRAILESDVILSVPKLKTHEKVGLTCAIKGCVGAVARKECLAHHRFGPPEIGGDEYPSDRTGLLRRLSAFHDRVQKIPHRHRAGNALRVVDRVARRVTRLVVPTTAGAWRGNDTTWRMAIDLARIVQYGTMEGRLADAPVRRHLVLVDGIVGGEDAGPLNPTPVHSGLVFFSDNIVTADTAAARFMGYDPHLLPIVREAGAPSVHPLACEDPLDCDIVVNGRTAGANDLAAVTGQKYRPPAGWRDWL